MSLSDNLVTISNPPNLNELFNFLSREPNAVFFAGGSWLSSNQKEKTLNIGKNIINLASIPDLKRIDRTERYIEFGSCVTLARIDNLRSQVIPTILHSVINTIGTQQIRNLATIGGNLAIEPIRMSLFPVLIALDAKIELRTYNKTRLIELRHFLDENQHLDLQKGELITKIRIPINPWNFQQYKVIGKRTALQEDFSVLSAVANITKNSIHEIRIILLDGATTLIRPIQTEGNLISKNIPLSKNAKHELTEIFFREISTHTELALLDSSDRFRRLFSQFLSELS